MINGSLNIYQICKMNEHRKSLTKLTCAQLRDIFTNTLYKHKGLELIPGFIPSEVHKARAAFNILCDRVGEDVTREKLGLPERKNLFKRIKEYFTK